MTRSPRPPLPKQASFGSPSRRPSRTQRAHIQESRPTSPGHGAGENPEQNFMERAAAMAQESNLDIDGSPSPDPPRLSRESHRRGSRENHPPRRSSVESCDSTAPHRGVDHPPPANTAATAAMPPPRTASPPPVQSDVRQYLSIHVHQTSSSKPVSAPGGLTYVVDAVDFKERRFLKLSNALTYAHHFGYSQRDFESEDTYHEVYKRLHGGRDGSNLYAILSRDVPRGEGRRASTLSLSGSETGSVNSGGKGAPQSSPP